MSWKSIPLNQTVSRANLQNAVDTGVFIAKNGVPATDTNREVTKANVEDYINAWSLYAPFRNKTSNQLPVKSNIAVQSNQIYAVGASSLFVGNTNRSWVYRILFTYGQDDWGSVASSIDNRCILAGRSYTSGGGGGGAVVSNDYGETFTFLGSVMTNNDAALATAMSSNGVYMVLTRQVGSFDQGDRTAIYFSFNSGVNWNIGFQDNVKYNFNGAAMSGSGVYATVLGSDGTYYYVFTSNGYGSGFNKAYLCNGSKTLITGCVGMSKSGQYQLLTPPEPTGSSLGYFYVSNDYGNSWTSIMLAPVPLLPNDIFKGCSVSAGGDYMTVVAYSTTQGQLKTYISSDWGVNWTVIANGSIAQAVDSSGQFQYQRSRQSIDYGNTWYDTNISSNSISVNQTTFTTPYIYGTSTGGNLYKSVDQGSSFSLISISGYFTKVATSGGSNNGKYVGAIKDNNPGGFPEYNLAISSNYGATWSFNFVTGGQVLSCCAVSDDGVYWLVAIYDDFYTYVYRSTDSGATFQYVTQANFFAQDCAVSSDGKYMTIIITRPSGSGKILNSTDYGESWIGESLSFTGNGYACIAMSSQGRYRAFATNTNLGARIYYSSDYGVNFAEDVYRENYRATSCALDDSGQVGLVSLVEFGNYQSLILYTTNGWDTESEYNTSGVYPLPLAPPLISGVNVSSDGTYWSGVSNNAAYSFTCTTGDGNFIPRTNNPDFNYLSK
jgi:hypothetical protein